MKHSAFGVLGLIGLIVGCRGSDEPLHPTLIVRDSSGIQIIAVGPIAEVVATFRLSEMPEYLVGWNTGDYQFQNVSAGHFLPGGQVVVADARAREVVMISTDGQVHEVWGGPGEGPGEFSGIPGMVIQGMDTIVVQDGVVHRLTFFHRDRVTGTLSIADLPMNLSRKVIGFDDRGRVLFQPVGTPFEHTFDEPWLKEFAIRLDPVVGAIDTAFAFDYVAHTNTREGHTFGPIGTFSMTQSGFVIGRSDITRMEFLDLEGQLTRILVWEEATALPTDAFWSDYIAEISARFPERNNVEASTESLKARGGRLPVFPIQTGGNSVILSDDEDRLWVAGFSAASYGLVDERYRVFSEEGEWLGWVEMPERSRILDIRDGRVLAIRYDQYRVPAIAVYRLEEVQ